MAGERESRCGKTAPRALERGYIFNGFTQPHRERGLPTADSMSSIRTE